MAKQPPAPHRGRPSDNQSLVLCWYVDRDRAVAHVAAQLKRDKGNMSATAAALGIHRRTLHRWVLVDRTLARALRDARNAAA
jgi:transcriptional regulator of acetoin/glycerol metabolism